MVNTYNVIYHSSVTPMLTALLANRLVILNAINYALRQFSLAAYEWVISGDVITPLPNLHFVSISKAMNTPKVRTSYYRLIFTI